MAITGKQVTIGVQIAKLAMEAKGIKSPTVNDIIDHAKIIGTLLAKDNLTKDRETITQAIITQMITIKAEAQ